ncbi:hypothetical protein J5690_03575 [bacterium]|nr:hypothetical protein [bacterium]
MELLSAIFTGVASALVTAWFTKSSADKKNSLQYITDERRKWRDEIRGKTVETVALLRKLETTKSNFSCLKNFDNPNYVELQKHIAFFGIRLNPIDNEDNAILGILKSFLPNGKQIDNPIEEFQDGIARLLKHDWERSKNEVNNKGKIALIIFSLIFTTLLCSPKSIKEGIEIVNCAFSAKIFFNSVQVLIDSNVLYLIAFFLDMVSIYYAIQLLLRFLSRNHNFVVTEKESKLFELFDVQLRVSRKKEEKNCIIKIKPFLCCLIFAFTVTLFSLYILVLCFGWNLCKIMTCCSKMTTIVIFFTTCIFSLILCKFCCDKIDKETTKKIETIEREHLARIEELEKQIKSDNKI